MTRTLVATVLYNAKGKKIYCKSNQINDQQLSNMKATENRALEERGFTFVNLVSPDYANVRGYAVFYEGHADELGKILNTLGHYNKAGQ